MTLFARLWEAYVNSGSHFFSSATDLKRNRMLNMLFSMAFMGGIYIALIELAFAAVLLQRDYERYITYLLPFAAATLVYPLLVAVTVLVKNLTGSFQVTFLNNVFINAFCFTLARFLGEKAQMHLIILSQFPIIFLFYKFGSWKSIVGHIVLVIFGVGATLVSYRVAQPLFPLPDDLADLPGYLCWVATFGMLVWYSVYNWKQVHFTERLLEDERDQTKELLDETIPKLEKAEAKYRHLVDDADDLIFLADARLTVLSMNKTAQRMLAYMPGDMIGKDFTDFVAESPNSDTELNRNIVREQMKQLISSGKLTRFRTRLMHKHRDDGVEVLLSLQLSRVNGEDEIIGRAIEMEPEVTLRFLNQEKGSYTLGNNILHADVLSQRIADRISLHYGQHELNSLRTCIREILINAIEHGNLGISFEEKTRIIEQGDFMSFLRQRQHEPLYATRKVMVRYVVNRTSLILRVTDEGDGFDHCSFLKRADEDESMVMLEHGRGITMTRNAFDSVEFNEKGNQVTLRKKHTVRAVPTAE